MFLRKQLAALALGVGLLGTGAAPAHAAVGVGDQPKLEFKAADGSAVSLERLKGKIVVVDFWATWCGPCMAEAGHMVELNKKYNPEGLQMIGISLDSDKAQMATVAKEKGFAWPQYVDGQAWQSKYAVDWDVHSIPRTFIIGPDGKVLWTGHPGQIDEPLAAAFKEHPPVLVDPKVLSDAKASVAAAETALKSGDTKTALAAMAKVPAAARADKEFAAQSDAVRKDLESAGAKMLAEVGPLVQAKQYVEAIGKLRSLGMALEGLPAGAQARKQLTDLEAKPEVKAAVSKAARADKSQALLEAAQALKTAKKDEQAYPKFKMIADEYTDTAAGAKASELVKVYEKDTAFIRRISEASASTKAVSTLRLAASYATAGRNDLARKKYQEVADQYPGTSFAEQAKTAIASLHE